MDSPSVLCIDNCPQVLELRKATLESHGYSVKIASNPKVFLSTMDGGRKIAAFPKKQTIFIQGDSSDAVFYVQKGKVKLTVVSQTGKDAMIHEKHSFRSAWPGFAVATLIVFGLLPYFMLLMGCGGTSPPAPGPPPPPPSSFSFVVWADTRGNYSTLAVLSAQAVTHKPAFTLYAGDGESNGFTTAGTNILLAAIDGNASNGLAAKTFLVRGNHDALDTPGWQQYYDLASVAGTVGATHYSAFTPDLTYSFDYQNSHFVAIDVPGDADVITSDQTSWLDSDLAAADARGLTHAFIYFHGPIFCVESVHCQFTGYSGSNAPPALIQVLNKHTIVSASFHGHEHVLAYTHVDTKRLPNLTHNFEEIVTGTAGAPNYACDLPARTEWCDPVNGFATVEVSGRAVVVDFYQQGILTPIKTVTFSK